MGRDAGAFVTSWFVMVFLARCGLLCAALVFGLDAEARAQAFKEVCTATSPPRLEASGANLLVDGQPRFSVFVSYFDVMRASAAAIEQDFAFLKSKGANGVRVFPLWIREAGLPSAQKPDATLLDGEGRIRSQERWDHFAMALKRAAQCGLLVDVTFSRENLDTVAGLTPAEYQGNPKATACAGGRGGTGLSEIACRLKGPEYAHVLFDLQNERNVGPKGMALTIAELKSIRDAVKAVAPDRLVMVSHGGGDINSTIEAARATGLDVIAFHEEQRRGWYEQTAAHVAALKAVGRPVYLQESGRATMPGERFRGADCASGAPGDGPFSKALLEARKAGAAAWTFHTDAGFRLDTQSFQKELAACPQETAFLDILSQRLR
jgi:hypothetical protein